MMLRESSLLLAAVLCVACTTGKPASGPKRPADPKCAGAYSPPVCLGDNLRCETDQNGCEICSCDSSPMPPP